MASTLPQSRRPEDAGPRSAAAPAPASGATGGVVEFDAVYKSFGRLEVLRNVSFSLRRGETTVIIGESGSGKSVLLKHIVGLLRPDAGKVIFRDPQSNRVYRMDALSEGDLVEPRRRFGFLFQLSALFDSMTVRENVGFPVEQHTHMTRAEVRQVVAHKLELVGLAGLEEKPVSSLSGGQKKRVALARAIAFDPEVILYDEPTTGLDPPRSAVINNLIKRMKEKMHATGIVVTHDMITVFDVADRVLMLKDGNFIFDGPPEALRASRDERIRRFVRGEMLEEDK